MTGPPGPRTSAAALAAYPYVPCSALQARDLLAAYDNAIRSATSLTTALDQLAVGAALPSAPLAEPRRNSPPRPGSLPPVAVTDQAAIVIPEAPFREVMFPCPRCQAGGCDATILILVPTGILLFLCPRCRAGVCDR
jgi:hypothetical protein